jgi:hypothetical protein
VKYQVKLTATAAGMFNNLHPDIKKQLKTTLKKLYKMPYLGKTLQNELVDFRSLKMKRYRTPSLFMPLVTAETSMRSSQNWFGSRLLKNVKDAVKKGNLNWQRSKNISKKRNIIPTPLL